MLIMPRTLVHLGLQRSLFMLFLVDSAFKDIHVVKCCSSSCLLIGSKISLNYWKLRLYA